MVRLPILRNAVDVSLFFIVVQNTKNQTGQLTKETVRSHYNTQNPLFSPKDLDLAGVDIQALQKEADKGNAEAQYKLGKCYISTDPKKAFHYFGLSSSQGDKVGQFYMGVCYSQGIGVAKNENTAFQWYQKSANQNNASAQNQVGFCYEYGIGVTPNYKKATHYYHLSARQGFLQAHANLGEYYLQRGAITEEKKGIHHLRVAADGGNADGQFGLASFYDEGRAVKTDHEMATKYFLKASEQGHAEAAFRLGIRYSVGLRVKRDTVLAHQYLKLAGDRGFDPTKQLIEKCGPGLKALGLNFTAT